MIFINDLGELLLHLCVGESYDVSVLEGLQMGDFSKDAGWQSIILTSISNIEKYFPQCTFFTCQSVLGNVELSFGPTFHETSQNLKFFGYFKRSETVDESPSFLIIYVGSPELRKNLSFQK